MSPGDVFCDKYAMTYNEKKQLYDRIMGEVAQTVKRRLDESVLDDLDRRPSDSVRTVADQSWNNAIN